MGRSRRADHQDPRRGRYQRQPRHAQAEQRTTTANAKCGCSPQAGTSGTIAIGAGALTATTGGFAVILASGRAPAYAQGSTVHWLRWNDFIPASDELLRKQIVPECQKALGVKLTIEMINANGIQARTTSAIQSGRGRM